MLMDSLLAQDISFFELTRTGDLTSRLSSDTTLVGSQITVNVSIFLRSIVRGTGVLILMFWISWQLTLIAFITIPAVTVISKWYGRYIRRLSKLQQKRVRKEAWLTKNSQHFAVLTWCLSMQLADGNSVSESAISSMATVRAFGAEKAELDEFEKCMESYLMLNTKNAVATLGFNTCFFAMPQLVKALVLFYGGLLVQSSGPNHISGGDLISFILYLESLSTSFNSLGYIFASMTRAVGAADKVYELMHRKPRLAPPSTFDEATIQELEKDAGMLGFRNRKVSTMKAGGLKPETCSGEVSLTNVEMRYPVRPQRVVLENMNLSIEPGSIVALVGHSGSGKSSVVSLIQHLYEPNHGEISIDGTSVSELNPDWLAQNVSVVSQEPTLFARSVKQNIIYGLEGTPKEPTQEEVEEAARLANAAEFIEVGCKTRLRGI